MSETLAIRPSWGFSGGRFVSRKTLVTPSSRSVSLRTGQTSSTSRAAAAPLPLEAAFAEWSEESLALSEEQWELGREIWPQY